METNSILNEIITLIKTEGNDMTLGSKIRNLINKTKNKKG
jgi:hypothetical protein